MIKMWPFGKLEKRSLSEPTLEDFGVFGLSSTSAGVSVSAESALRVPAVACAVSTISGAVASLKVGVVEIAADGTETAKPDHPVNKLLRGEANGWTSGFELIRSLIVDALCLDAGGLAWINRVGSEVREIVNPARGVIAEDRDSVTLQPSYRWQGAPLNAADVIHVRAPLGKAPLTLAREAIGVASVMEKHAGKLFSNGAKPGGVISVPGKLGDEGLKAMLASWRRAHEGPDQTGRTAVLWDGAVWQQMTLNSVDAQFQELRLFQLQEIARAFNIPASMLGDLSRATWSNSAEMRLTFLALCLEPWLRAIEAAFNRALFPSEERGRLAVRFERDDFSNVDLSTRATAISSLVASRVINPNTARAWLDLPPRDGGEEYSNPNTGVSQPGGLIGAAAPQPAKEASNGSV